MRAKTAGRVRECASGWSLAVVHHRRGHGLDILHIRRRGTARKRAGGGGSGAGVSGELALSSDVARVCEEKC